MPDRRANRLAEEKSPYLLEHAQNPVDWYPWGKEAFQKAKNDNKPIFLSIGYSSCHWCHQMAKESFEDEKVAGVLNKNFIAVKVDREERPEVDAYYMDAVQAMTGGGGWPLSVFLTPDLKPFYGGTYFPPDPRYGMPSFVQVVEFVGRLWKDQRGEVVDNTERVQKALDELAKSEAGEVGKGVFDDCFADLVSTYDSAQGGFGTAPKFPLPGSLDFLLRYHFRTGNDLALASVTKTLDHMLAGGIRDHLGGGFHRYSTDRVWLVPHFEKMLYDNALLAKAYTEALQVTGKEGYGEVARETLGWLIREMESPRGGFYSAQDADTVDGEGVYYSWTPREVSEVLGESAGALFCGAFGVTATGNFDGRSLLHLDPSAKPTRGETAELVGYKKALYEARLKRHRPAIDDKVMTSWNGLAISALAFAGAVLGEPEYLAHAARAADFILEVNSREGRLLRRYAGGEAALQGTLQDYAYFVQGLIDLFESAQDPRWIEEARRLAEAMVEEFEDSKDGGFFLTREFQPARLKDNYDGPTPSGNSVAVMDLVRLSELTGNRDYRITAERAVRAFGKEIEARPSAHTAMLAGADLLLNGVREVVVTAPDEAGATGMKDEVFRRFAPDRVFVVATPGTYQDLRRLSGLLEGREPGKKAVGYVCRGFSCKIPAGTASMLGSQLAAH